MNDRAPLVPQRTEAPAPPIRAPAPAPRHAWGGVTARGTAEPSRFAHDFTGIRLRAPSGTLQPRLAIGAVDDAYEREAERVASAVMSGGAAGPVVSSSTPEDRVQRLCPHCEAAAGSAPQAEEDDETPVHA
ncbi:MAG TPA: hypothetical protein VHG93_15980 [Longimicrobium sp.]|nr:hypothetical protein [Longimicrobium sp.]